MNRIQSRKPAAKTSPVGATPSQGSPFQGVTEAVVSRAAPDQAPHAVFAPLHYERNYAYPLVIWLHGSGNDETQLKRIMPLVSLRNYVAIAPRGMAYASENESTSESPPAVFEWRQTEDGIHLAEQRVLECLAAARAKFHLAAGRIFLAGHDCGGTMALRLALRAPRQFAGALSLGGRFPTGHAPLARLAEARHLSILIGCTRASQRYPSAAVCDDLRLLHSTGLSLTLREYPGADGLPPQMLSDMDRWLMEQITGTSVSTAAPASSQTG